MSFSTKAKVNQNGTLPEEGGQVKNQFIRSKKGGSLFKELEIESLKPLVTDDCTNAIDADSIPFKCASACEDDYIIVKNLKEEPDVDSKTKFPEEVEYKNKTSFKGAARGLNISVGSVLGDMNLKREAFGLEPYTMEDFELISKKRLKYEDGVTIDEIEFNNTFEVCKYYINKWVEAIKLQTEIPNVLLVLGQGENHRHDLLLPHQYKSDRSSDRPLLLGEARKYILDTLPSEMAQQREEGVSRGLEADEVCDEYGFKGYVNYRKTGKFSWIKSSIDKDNWNSCGISFNYTKAFHFEYPRAWLIEHRDIYTGTLELVKGKIKGTGLKHAVYQIILEDSADEYGSRKYLPEDMKKGISYGPAAFYKDFIALETPKEILEKVVDIFYEWFPKGLRYIAWDGTEIHEDTLSWLNKCFLCMYMRLKTDDPTQITNWLDQYEVDYTKLINNHIDKPKKLAPEGNIRETHAKVCGMLESISEEVSDLKGKKSDLEDRLKKAKVDLEGVWIELGNGLFLDELVSPKPKGRDLEEYILEYSKEKDYSTEEPFPMETLRECLVSEEISTETISEHRWYDVKETLCKVVIDKEDRFFKIPSHYTKGDIDNDLDDFKVSDVYEVFPIKKEVTVYE